MSDLPIVRAQGAADSAAESGTATRDAAIQKTVDELASWVKSSGGRVTAAVGSVRGDRLLAAASETTALNPASNQKVLTAAAALAELGPEYRYTTGIYGKLQDGVATSLVIRGHGDPSLRTEDLYRLASALVGKGLRRVDGSILVDQSRFDARFVPPAFDQQPNEWASFRAPVSAVALNANALTLHVTPARAGQPAKAWFDPPGYVSITGSVATEATGRGNAVRLTVNESGGRARATLGGHMAEGLPDARFTRRVDDPRIVAGHTLKHLLVSLGVEVRGEVGEGGKGEQGELVVHRSAPLGELLSALGKDSDNFYAEMILKTLGAEAKGQPASSAAGAQVIVEWLQKQRAVTPGMVIGNGSGLFDANRVSALTFVRALAAGYRDPGIGPEFVAQLATGGVDGTLRSRFRQHRQSRIIRAKTGTLNRVVALSGFVLAPPGKSPVAFSLIVTDLPGKHTETRRRIDAIVDAIAKHLHG